MSTLQVSITIPETLSDERRVRAESGAEPTCGRLLATAPTGPGSPLTPSATLRVRVSPCPTPATRKQRRSCQQRALPAAAAALQQIDGRQAPRAWPRIEGSKDLAVVAETEQLCSWS